MNLWIVDNIVPFNRINSEWNIIFPVLKHIIKEKHIFTRVEYIFSTTNVPNSEYHWYVVYQNSIMNELVKNINYIEDRDVILFTDSRFYGLPMILEYLRLQKKKPYIMAIWNDGLYIKDSQIFNYYKNAGIKIPAYRFERVTLPFIDLNIISLKEFQTDLFQIISSKKVYCPLPMDLLEPAYELIQMTPNTVDKTSEIIYSSVNGLENYERQFSIIKREMSDYNFTDISEIKTSNILRYLNYFNRAKYYIDLSLTRENPMYLYHLCVLGIIPLTSYTGIIRNLTEHGDYFLKPRKLVDTSYKFIRYISEISDKIKFLEEDFILNLEFYKQTFKKLYNTNEFVNLLYNVANRK